MGNTCSYNILCNSYRIGYISNMLNRLYNPKSNRGIFFMKTKEDIEKVIKRLEDQNKELPAHAENWATIQKYCNNTALMYLKWVVEE